MDMCYTHTYSLHCGWSIIAAAAATIVASFMTMTLPQSAKHDTCMHDWWNRIRNLDSARDAAVYRLSMGSLRHYRTPYRYECLDPDRGGILDWKVKLPLHDYDTKTHALLGFRFLRAKVIVVRVKLWMLSTLSLHVLHKLSLAHQWQTNRSFAVDINYSPNIYSILQVNGARTTHTSTRIRAALWPCESDFPSRRKHKRSLRCTL